MTEHRAIEVIERKMRECSAQSADCRRRGDHTGMFKLNVAWHWLNDVRLELDGIHGEFPPDKES